MTTSTTSTAKIYAKRAPLVGKKHIIDCFIQGHSVKALWDSGSQVTIIDQPWKERYLPDTRLRDISEILDITETLNIVAANGKSMPYAGWVEMTFRLASQGAPTTEEVIVPTLVMKDSIALPLIGSNVNGLIVDIEMKKSNSTDKGKLNEAIRAVFPDHTKAFVEQVIAVIENASAEQGHEYVVKTKKNRVNIPKHMSVQVECHVQME